MNIYPKQAVSSAEKNTPEWQKANQDYWISMAAYGGAVYTEMNTLLKAAEGHIDPADYDYVLNPYNTDNDLLKAMPSKLRNYPIIEEVLALFLGEESKKPRNAEVVVIDDDVETRYKSDLEEKLTAVMAQMAINELNAQGMKTGVDSKPVADPAQAAQQHKENWSDNLAEDGQSILDYILAFNNFDELRSQFLHDYLSLGRFISYKDVRYDDVVYERVDPREFWCLKSPNTTFVEDSVAQVRRSFMLINDIIDRWRNKLTEEQIMRLDAEINQKNAPGEATGFTYIPSETMDGVSSYYGRYASGTVEVYHVCWKTLTKVGIVHRIDPILGTPSEEEVDDTYVLNPETGDVNIEWEWLSEGWESRRIGNDIYMPTERIWVQRTELNNHSITKLPYNGRIELTVEGRIKSVVKTGMVYQALYNVYHYRRELTINRNKDKIMMMPLGLIPNQFGKDKMDKFMHYMEANSIGFFDESKPNAAAVMQALKSIDMGLFQYIKGMTEVLESVKAEWWDAIGMNRQRYGDTSASEGKGVTEQAIFRSSIISAERNRKFGKALETDYNGLLDCSKFAFINGKKANYVTPDRRKVMMNIDPQKHLGTSYGIFSVDSDQEYANLEKMKEYGFAMAQKGNVESNTVAEIIEGKNFARLKNILKKADEATRALQASQEQAKNETAKYVADKTSEDNDKKLDTQKYVADKNYEAIVDAAVIAADSKVAVAGTKSAQEGVVEDNTSDLEKIVVDRQKMLLENEVKRADILERTTSNLRKDNIAAEKLKVEREKIAAQKQIARMKPKTSK